MDALPGMTAMPVRAGFVTVRTLVVVVLPEVAVMVAVPAATPVARPVLLMVATAALLVDQATVEVHWVLVLLEYEQVAVYCSVPVPATMEGAAAPIEIPVSAGLKTVSVLDPVVLPDVALIFAVPVVTPRTTPGLVILAADVLVLDQVTVPVQSEVVLFAKLQVALYWLIVKPATTVAVAGVTVMLFKGTLVTVRALVALMVPEAAVIVVDPTATPVARPVLETVAMAGLLLVHVIDVGHAAVEPPA